MNDLEVSESVYAAGEAALAHYPIAEVDQLDAASDVIHAAAPLIVAAELRRLAVPYGEREDICAGDRDRLLARADQLDPAGPGHAHG